MIKIYSKSLQENMWFDSEKESITFSDGSTESRESLDKITKILKKFNGKVLERTKFDDKKYYIDETGIIKEIPKGRTKNRPKGKGWNKKKHR